MLKIGSVIILRFLTHRVTRTRSSRITTERGSSARNWCGQERWFLLSRHDHEEFLLNDRQYFQFIVLTGLAELEILISEATTAGVEVTGELPVGAIEDEEGEGDEAQYHRQDAEEVRHRLVPRRHLRRRRRGCVRDICAHHFCLTISA
ncbi:glutamine dumper 1 [Actinidia rufa]|uniref:Glutamine dumper 1 n=1 Tax=Actinidia rufa TaxID=165716 RepID=A0A7J0G3E5_9ERIC|nr:glutamine dumper 1 [Actinidia rufa]